MENALLSNFHFFTEILRFPYIRVIFRKKMESSKNRCYRYFRQSRYSFMLHYISSDTHSVSTFFTENFKSPYIRDIFRKKNGK